MNEKKLRAKMLEGNYNVVSLSKYLEISPSTFYRKLRTEGFEIGEANKIVTALGLLSQDASDIFFSCTVS